MTFAACGGDEACTTLGCEQSDTTTQSSQPGAGSGGTSSSLPGGGSFIDPNEAAAGTSGLNEGEVCQAVALQAQASPVNVLILLDRSTSMLEDADPAVPGVSRWDAVTGALRAFVNSPQAQGARIGLQFFGLMNGADDCEVPKYAAPAVPVAPLATNRDALLSVIDSTLPGSLTPTAPAVAGALQYALTVAQAPENADVPTVMVLASDGIPSECTPLGPDGQPIFSISDVLDTLEAYSQPPADAAGNPTQPPIRTFIVGTEDLRSNAAQLAEAGNAQAFLVGGGTDNPDLQARFLDALLSIIVRPLDCELDVPQTAPETGERVDFEKVRLRYTGAASGAVTEFPRTDGPQGCGVNEAWFYEAANPPTKIFLCSRACERLGAGELKLELGCSPQQVLR